MTTETHPPASKGFSLSRAAPMLIILAGAVAGYFLLKDYLTFETLRENREALTGWVAENFLLAVLVYGLVYICAVAFSLPGGALLTVTGGFLFGMLWGPVATVLAATIGATLIFLAARTGFGDALRAKAGGWVKKFESEVQENEISFMLLLRLVPAVPFFIANVVPAFLGVNLRTYIWTTLVGIIPGTAVYSWVGAGLGEVFDQGGVPNFGIIFEPQILAPLLGLSVLAALPIVIKKLRKKDA